MGFDDLNDALNQQDSNDEKGEPPEQSPEIKQGEQTETMTETESETTTASNTDQPAFPYDDATQKAIYPTSDTWAAFEDTLDFEVKRELRDSGIRNIPKREYHEALLQLANENPERLAELVKQNRIA